MKKFIPLLIFHLLFLSIPGVAIESSASESRMIKETVGPDQSRKMAKGLPVIISKKIYQIVITPESLFSEQKSPVEFTLGFMNPTEEPWSFSTNDIKAYSKKTQLEILEPDKIIEEARQEFSSGEYKVSREGREALAPYIEEKMQMLRGRLLKGGTIPPGGKLLGLIAVRVPVGTDEFTIQISAPGETHEFHFDVIEFK